MPLPITPFTFDATVILIMLSGGPIAWWICSVVAWWTVGCSFKDALLRRYKVEEGCPGCGRKSAIYSCPCKEE